MNHLRRPLRTAGALALLLGLLAPVAALAMDADELIAKYVEASGGKDALKAVQSRQAVGKFSIQGMEIPFTMTNKRPDKLRIEATIMGLTMVQCFDGEKGWAINPMTGSTDPQPMTPVEEKGVRLQADMDGGLVDYAAKGYTVEYLGEDEVEGTRVHKLRMDTGQDIVVDFYIDQERFLPVRQDSKVTVEGSVVESQTYLGDYREVDGMVVPFSIETRMGDTTVNRIVMESVSHGIEIDDSIFAMPEAAAGK